MIWSPLTGVSFVFRGSEGDVRLRSRFFVIFPLLLQECILQIIIIFLPKFHKNIQKNAFFLVSRNIFGFFSSRCLDSEDSDTVVLNILQHSSTPEIKLYLFYKLSLCIYIYNAFVWKQNIWRECYMNNSFDLSIISKVPLLIN